MKAAVASLNTFIRFGGVGAICFVLNVALMASLVSMAGASIVTATVVCFLVINAVGHFLNRKHVFVNSGRSYFSSLLRFGWVAAISLGANVSLMVIATEHLKIHYLVASTLIAALFTVLNFLAHQNFSFRQAKRPP